MRASSERCFADGSRELVHHHRNPLGSLQMVTDAMGHVLEREADVFSPFGDSPTYFGEPLFFTGHERGPIDSMGGLDSMHARYHTAHSKRFLSLDPVGGDPASPQSWDRYSHVLNIPLRYVDSFGLSEADCTMSGGPRHELQWSRLNSRVLPGLRQCRTGMEEARARDADVRTAVAPNVALPLPPTPQ